MVTIMPSIVVDESGTKLSYIDSGAPDRVANYVTIFAIHGTVFAGREYSVLFDCLTHSDLHNCTAIWDRVIALAPKAGVRFVAVNRRDYPGSTPLSPGELNVLNSGTDEQKSKYLKARGVEFATFFDTFAERNTLSSISSDGSSGGFAVLGWSLGCTFALASIAAVEALPAHVQERWKTRMRSLILQGMFSKSLYLLFTI